MRPFLMTLAAVLLTASVATAMEFDDVMELLRAGVGEDIILAQVEAEDAEFNLDTDSIVALKQAGASDDLIRELIAARDDGRRSPDDSDWRDGYYGNDYYGRSRVAVSIGYDPFGYYWSSSPYYFAYYYPYRCVDFGFYYAGWYNRGWWGWDGYWPSYYRDYCRVNYHDYKWWRHEPNHWSRYDDRAEGAAWTRDSRGTNGRSWNRDTDRPDRTNGRTIDRTRTTPRVTAPDRNTRQPAQPRERDRSWSRSRDSRSPDRVYSQPRAPRSGDARPSPPSRTAPSGDRSGGSNGSGRSGGWRR